MLGKTKAPMANVKCNDRGQTKVSFRDLSTT